jgi:hypothetical protein
MGRPTEPLRLLNRYSVRRWRDQWWVFDATGLRVGLGYADPAAAHRVCAELQASADRRAQRQVRPCLCCNVPFFSEGIHNRLCGDCRQLSAA